MFRKGDALLPGITGTTLPYITQMDNDGRVVFDTFLGGAGVAASNDFSLWLYAPGAGSTLLVREGDPAPGTIGGTFNNSLNDWQPGMGAASFTRSGKYLFSAELMNGDVLPGFNERAVY